MKSFYTTYYRFYKPEQRENKILAISDIHFNDRISESLKAILHRAEADEPSLILITGDIVDEQDALDTTAERARLKTWLEHLGAVAPVCLCLGNHDYFRRDIARGRVYQEPSILVQELANIPNVFLLDDAEFENENHFVFGLTLPQSTTAKAPTSAARTSKFSAKGSTPSKTASQNFLPKKRRFLSPIPRYF